MYITITCDGVKLLDMHVKDADSLAEQAETQGRLDLLTKSNALRKAAAWKKDLILDIGKDLKDAKSKIF